MNPFNNEYINLPPELLVFVGGVFLIGLVLAIIESIKTHIPVSQIIIDFFNEI